QALRGRLLRGARDELVHREAHHVGGAGQVEPLHVELLHRRLVDEQDRHLGGRVQVHRLEDEAGELDELALVDDRGGLVADLARHGRSPSCGRWRGSRLPPGRISQRRWASTRWRTRRWRTTSREERRQGEMSSMPDSTCSATRSPLFWAPGRSTWVTSPVTTMVELNPRRVRNIFICSGVVFCASSRMMNASLRVRPRMYASGAISIVPDSNNVGIESGSTMSCNASYSGRRYGSIFSYSPPGRYPSRSPASTAGRARMMRLICLSCSAWTAFATVR